MHQDERGKIEDLMVTDTYSITHITFAKGAVRGNHFHAETMQVDTVLSGKLLCVYKRAGKTTKETVLVAGDSLVHEQKTSHAYKALSPAEIVSVCIGKRRGEHYAEDTFPDKLI